MVFLGILRIGEAKHPGPTCSSEWTLGTFNPCGLDNKADIAAQQQGDFWGVTETHLSRHGVAKFKKGLRCNRTDFRYVVPGKPCPLHSRSDVVGNHSGVLAMSKWPCRALPNDLPAEIFDTARTQVVGVAIHGLWITVGLCYGYPKSTTHLHPKFCTEQHLEALVNRVACQSHGPRVIMGDFNWEAHELHQLARLEALGFQDIQVLANNWWNQPIRPTGRGTRRIDFVYVSPELAGMLKRVEIDSEQWPDHSSVAGVFAFNGNPLETFHWHMPAPTQWPDHPWEVVQFEWNQCNSTEAYARFWNQVETTASLSHQQNGGMAFEKACLGRGQILNSRKIAFSHAPIKKSRTGEIDPGYYGDSVKYSQQFKQARRLQSLVKALQSGSKNQAIHAPDLWYRIRHSTGFPGGFSMWWKQVGSKFRDGPSEVPVLVPSVSDAEIFFAGVQDAVKQFEKQLLRNRIKHAKEKRAQDLRFVFKDCARDQPNKVEMLVDSYAAVVQCVNPDDQSIELDPPLTKNPDIPPCSGGKRLDVIHHEPDRVWLEDVAHIHPGDVVRQTRVVADDETILERFRQEWEPRWVRVGKVLPSQWDQIAQFLEATVPKVSWPFRSWDCKLFQTAVKSKKASAATGPDGVSRSDLLKMPQSVVEGIVTLFEHIETTHCWPAQVSTGFVSALEKKPGSLQVGSFRPITIYSILYRIWSSVRAADFLKTFKKVVPEGVRGGIPSRQARSIWYEAAQLLEQSHLSNLPYVGIVADLVKAFNQIPREPIWLALQALGCPSWFIMTWASFVGCQCRRFRVRKSVGAAIPSDVGFPEGCALSISAMSIIDFMLDRWLAPIHPTIQVFSFVDDWQILHRAIEMHETIMMELHNFVKAVAMQIDFQKSFVWAIRAKDRQALRNSSLKLVLSARELGAHLNFCKRAGNSTLVDRITSLTPTWTMMRSSLSPYRHKIIALKMLAWPRSLHGVSVAPLGPLHFVGLRTGALRGLRQDRIGSNPCLHLPLAGFTADPEGFAIYQTIKDARELSNPDYFRSMLGLFAEDPTQFPNNGPVPILVKRLQRLGWRVQANGYFVDNIGAFDLFSTHIDSLKARIAFSWGWVLTSEVSHRKDFQGIQFADLAMVSSIIPKFADADQVYLRCSLDGTMVTQKDRKHFEAENDGSCPFCHHPDGYAHRVWDCEFFQDCRTEFPADLQPMLSQLPPCSLEHAWPIRPASFDELAGILQQTPDFDPSDYRLEFCQHDVVDLFTDGTCQYPTMHPIRHAAWAVTVALPEGNMFDNELIAAGGVPGLHQTSYRAELFGVKHALEIASRIPGRKVRIWSDCQSIIGAAKRIQYLHMAVKPNRSHSDLWEVVEYHIQQLGAKLQFQQVFSHNDVSAGFNQCESWAYWHNSITDHAATQMAQKRSPVFWECWNRAYDDYHNQARCAYERRLCM